MQLVHMQRHFNDSANTKAIANSDGPDYHPHSKSNT
jgi:hypothetical protein